MTHPDSQPQELLKPEFADDPLWRQHIGSMAVELAHFEEAMDPDSHMHPVGMLDLDFVGSRQAFLPGLGEGHTALAGDETHIDQSVYAAQSLVLQMLESVPAGTARLRVYNGYLAEHTGAFADFAKTLGPTLFEQVEPGHLKGFLNSIEARNLDLANRRATVGSQTEPWEIAVIMEDDELDERDQRQLNKLVAAGPKYGSIVTVGLPMQQGGHVHGKWPFPVEYDKPLAGEDIQARCYKIAIEAGKAFKSPDLGVIMAPEKWTRTAHHGLQAAIGLDTEGKPFEISFDNKTPHGLMLGPTGMGKSNTLEVMIASMARNYSPDELELFLLDHKLGVEFAGYAQDEYLPHARVVGTNVNRDPELAVAVLAKMKEEIERRADLFHEYGVKEYADMRDVDPDRRLPRMLTLIDEVQVPLKSPIKDREMAALLDYVASQGRAFGVHLLLASQKIDDIRAIQTQNLWENFALRIATRQGTVLNRENDTPESLPEFHVLVNTAKGKTDAEAKQAVNHVVWVASVRGGQDVPYQQEAYRDRGTDARPPRVFDGAIVPRLEQSRSFQRLRPVRNPRILLGETMSVEDRPAQFMLSRDPGRNLAVIGSGEGRRREANDVLRSAALSYGLQRRPEDAEISLICLDAQSEDAATHTAEVLGMQGHDVKVHWPEDAPQFLSDVHNTLDLTPEKSRLVVVYGADSGGSRMSDPLKLRHPIDIGSHELRTSESAEVMQGITTVMTDANGAPIKAPYSGTVKIRDGKIIIEESTLSGRQLLREIMRHGPENGTSVLASFSTVGLLHETLEDRKSPTRPDFIGAYVALGIPPENLRALTLEDLTVLGVTGHERPWRGLFYDRFSGKPPEILSLYGSPRRTENEDE